MARLSPSPFLIYSKALSMDLKARSWVRIPETVPWLAVPIEALGGERAAEIFSTERGGLLTPHQKAKLIEFSARRFRGYFRLRFTFSALY